MSYSQGSQRYIDKLLYFVEDNYLSRYFDQYQKGRGNYSSSFPALSDFVPYQAETIIASRQPDFPKPVLRQLYLPIEC